MPFQTVAVWLDTYSFVTRPPALIITIAACETCGRGVLLSLRDEVGRLTRCGLKDTYRPSHGLLPLVQSRGR